MLSNVNSAKALAHFPRPQVYKGGAGTGRWYRVEARQDDFMGACCAHYRVNAMGNNREEGGGSK